MIGRNKTWTKRRPLYLLRGLVVQTSARCHPACALLTQDARRSTPAACSSCHQCISGPTMEAKGQHDAFMLTAVGRCSTLEAQLIPACGSATGGTSTQTPHVQRGKRRHADSIRSAKQQ